MLKRCDILAQSSTVQAIFKVYVNVSINQVNFSLQHSDLVILLLLHRSLAETGFLDYDLARLSYTPYALCYKLRVLSHRVH